MRKLHETGFNALGLDKKVDGLAVSVLKILTKGPSPSCLLWHDDHFDETLRDLLRANRELWVTWLSASPVKVSQQDRHEFGDRLYGLGWGLPTLTDGQVWEDQLAWRRGCIERFVKHAQLPATVRPDWSLMEAPETPEHIIACYICALAGSGPEESWAQRFRQEVEYWRGRPDGRDLPELDWSRDSTDIGRLKDFLRISGTLVTGQAVVRLAGK